MNKGKLWYELCFCTMLALKHAAFECLIKKKNGQTKIQDVEYSKLEIQEYLLEGNSNTDICIKTYL